MKRYTQLLLKAFAIAFLIGSPLFAITEEQINREHLVEKFVVPPKIYYSSHPGAFHKAVFVSFSGDVLHFEDGSSWGVYFEDRYKTCNWLTSDTLVILPNNNLYSPYKYKVYNQNTGEYLRVDLINGRVSMTPYTRWIVAIDYYNREICLDDGSIWTISSSENGILNHWMLNEIVFIGINDSWFSSKPNILINAWRYERVAARCEN